MIEVFVGTELQPIHEHAGDDVSACSVACFSEEVMWPSCKLPIVGTKATRSEAWGARREMRQWKYESAWLESVTMFG